MNAYVTAPLSSHFRTLTPEELQLSLQASLQHWDQRSDVWVFAYGSLIWRPEFEFVEKQPARLMGYHRSLCLWSRINRGTPDNPGIVFALDEGGECEGVAYKVAADQVKATFPALWQREMPSGAYNPRWVECQTANQQTVSALTFIINPLTDAYVPSMPLEQLRHVIHRAHGLNGPCIDYVLQTAQALKRANIADSKLEHLVQYL